MKIKTNVLKYKDPDTGVYTPIPVVVSGDNEEIKKEINELNENLVQKVDQADLKEEVENQIDGAKASIVSDIITQLGGLPVFGTVDNNNIITVTSPLSDGEYVLKYENENGSIVEIGTIVIGNGESGEPDEPITPVETNQIRLSVDANGNDYVGHNGEDGYSAGYRVNSSGVEAQQDGMCCTGYMPYNGENITLENITITGTKTPYIVIYRADKSYEQVVSITDHLTDDGNGKYTGTLSKVTSDALVTGNAFIRITCGVIDDTSIITFV